MNRIEIKLLTPSEVPEIVDLDRLCLGGLWTAEAYLREIDSSSSSLLTLQLVSSEFGQDREQMIGMACLWSIVEEAHITLLGIHPEYRRQGLGQLLLFSLLENAIARQLAWATLEVNVNNLAALSLYQKLGFQIAGRRKGYYQPTGDDALVLWLKGLQHPEFQAQLSRWQLQLSDRLSTNSYYLSQNKIC
ncbi:MAG: ribosomal protein S18-alanine N-acetyltransferase [Cyanobacteria bacterium P01_G01_bin.67]